MTKPILITCHGYTGYPEEMEPVGKYFEGKGFEWINLTLPGHNSTPEDLRKTTWKVWTTYVDEIINNTIKQGREVYFAGLSLGGAMTLYALEMHPKIKAGIAFAAPAKSILSSFQRFLAKIPFIGFWIEKTEIGSLDVVDGMGNEIHRDYKKHHTDSVKQLDQFIGYVRKNLDKITQPLLLIHGTADRVIPVESADIIFENVSSEKKQKLLVNAGHVLTREKKREEWFEKAYEFIHEQFLT